MLRIMAVTTGPSTLDLDAIVRQYPDLPSLDAAAAVLADIPEEMYAPALAQVLPVFIEAVRTEDARLAEVADEAKPEQAAPRRQQQVTRRKRTLTEADYFNTPLRVGDSFKLLGECTADDLAQVADRFRTQARQIVARSKGYDNLAKHLREHNLQYVRDADQELVKRFLA